MAKKDEKTLESQVKRIILRQGVQYLSDAMDTLHSISTSADAPQNARVQASRAIVNALSQASEGMSEDQAGEELLAALQAAEHLSDVHTDVPKGIRESMDDSA